MKLELQYFLTVFLTYHLLEAVFAMVYSNLVLLLLIEQPRGQPIFFFMCRS